MCIDVDDVISAGAAVDEIAEIAMDVDVDVGAVEVGREDVVGVGLVVGVAAVARLAGVVSGSMSTI